MLVCYWTLGRHGWLDWIRLAPLLIFARLLANRIASINRAATMRATTLVLLVAGAAALQPALRVHAAARPGRTSAQCENNERNRRPDGKLILMLVTLDRVPGVVQPPCIEQTRRCGAAHTGVARAGQREDGLGGDVEPQPRELDSDAELD